MENPKKQTVIAFPHFGKYTENFKNLFETLGIKVVLPPKITDKTIKLGAKHSSEMFCFPYKATLGNFIELLEINPDIDYLLMYDSQGQCRFRHYCTLQQQTLHDLGYKVKMLAISSKTLFKIPKILNPEIGILKIIKIYIQAVRKIQKLSRTNKVSKEKPNVLIIGEIYTCIEPSINYHMEERMEKAGINPINTVDLFSFLKESVKDMLPAFFSIGKYERMAKKYLNGPLGGHGLENIENLLKYSDKGIQGVIWLRPLTCMPETTIDLVAKRICRDKKVPLLIFDIDESNFALNIETRLETFIEQIKSNSSV
jgi:predicted nucleotide-binding protein (sugar kinase/HSP70/actin superfamily)